MDDEILELNNQINGWIHLINMRIHEIPGVMDIKDEDQKYKAYSYLFDVKQALREAAENMTTLIIDFEYD